MIDNLMSSENAPLWFGIAGVVVVTLLLALGLSSLLGGDDGDNAPAEPRSVITVPFQQTQVHGHWIHIWGTSYRDALQVVVDVNAPNINTPAPRVQLGGYVFADAYNRPNGFYCPPAGTVVGSVSQPEAPADPNATPAPTPTLFPTPAPPVTLNGCTPVTLNAELTGYSE